MGNGIEADEVIVLGHAYGFNLTCECDKGESLKEIKRKNLLE